MTEPSSTPAGGEEQSQAEETRDVAHAGGGRTAGETAVDDELGSGPATPE